MLYGGYKMNNDAVGIAYCKGGDSDTCTKLAITQALEQMQGRTPQLALVYAFGYTQFAPLSEQLDTRLDRQTKVCGATCGGLLVDGNYIGTDTPAVGVMLVYSDDMAFGIGYSGGFGDAHAAQVGEEVIKGAIADSGRDGMPSMVLVHQRSGTEEGVLQGIGNVIDDKVNLVGGTAASYNDTPAKVFTSGGVYEEGVAVLAVYTARQTASDFIGPYQGLRKEEGAVTMASGRSIVTIDGRRALDVYDMWRQHLMLSSLLDAPEQVSAAGSHSPIIRASDGRCTHVSGYREDGRLITGTGWNGGEQIYVVNADRRAIVRQLEGLVEPNSSWEVLVACAGSMSVLSDEEKGGLADTLASSSKTMAWSSHGEQGRLDGRLTHANLMFNRGRVLDI